MADGSTFEARLEQRLRARAATAVRPFDAAEIAHKAIATGARRRGIGRIALPFTRPSLAWTVIALLLVIALIGAITFAGALLRRGPTGATNGWLAFAAGDGTRPGGSDIYLVKNGVAERRIIGTDGDGLRQVCPSFSPDGHRLAYSEAQADANGLAPTAPSAVVIFNVGPDGGPVGPVMHFEAPSTGDVCPKWAPDGQSVAFLANGEQPALWIARLDGTETPVVASEGINLDGFPGQFDWSPDGTALVAVGSDSSSLWIVPLVAGQARLLHHPGLPTSDRPSDQAQPKWSPDGTRIAMVVTTFANAPDGPTPTGTTVEVYQADGTGSGIELAGGSNLAWSPDGARLNFVLGQDEIVSVAPEVNDVRYIATDLHGIGGFVWSPDRTRLVYADLANQGASGALVSVSAAGDPDPITLTQQPHNLEFTDSNSFSWQTVFP